MLLFGVFAMMHSLAISSADPHPRRRVGVLDTEMSFVDTGMSQADPIVFLNENFKLCLPVAYDARAAMIRSE